MKVAEVLIDIRAYPEGPNRTTLLYGKHNPEVLPDHWVRFIAPDGRVCDIPPSMILRITYEPETAVLDRIVETSVVMESVDMSLKRRGRPPKSI